MQGYVSHSCATGRLAERESVAPTKKGRGDGPRSLLLDFGDAAIAAPRHANFRPRRSSRRISAARQTADRMTATPEPSIPPFARASPISSERFTTPSRPQTPVARQADIPGIPISPGGPACSDRSRVRGTSSCLFASAVRCEQYARTRPSGDNFARDFYRRRLRAGITDDIRWSCNVGQSQSSLSLQPWRPCTDVVSQ